MPSRTRALRSPTSRSSPAWESITVTGRHRTTVSGLPDLQGSLPFAHQYQVERFKGFGYEDMEAQNHKTLAFNAVLDPCPSLTMYQVELQGTRCGDTEAQNVVTLASNSFKDLAPSLTKKQGGLRMAVDNGDREAQNGKTLAFNAFKDPCPRSPSTGRAHQGIRPRRHEGAQHKTLAFNAFKDPGPFAHQLPGRALQGIRYGDMKGQNDKALAFTAFKDPGP